MCGCKTPKDSEESIVSSPVKIASVGGKWTMFFASTIGAVKCDHCSDWMLKEGLKDTIMVRIVVVVEGSELTLTATKKRCIGIEQDCKVLYR